MKIRIIPSKRRLFYYFLLAIAIFVLSFAVSLVVIQYNTSGLDSLILRSLGIGIILANTIMPFLITKYSLVFRIIYGIVVGLFAAGVTMFLTDLLPSLLNIYLFATFFSALIWETSYRLLQYFIPRRLLLI